jgi:hypothetical protein
MASPDDGSSYRALRWLGRILSLLSLWPLWYGLFAKSQLDGEALMFGGPGLLVGLSLWGWAGYHARLRETESSSTTVGGLLAARFDAVVAAGRGSVATLLLIIVTGSLAYATVVVLARTDGRHLEAAVALAIVFGLLTLGWRAARGPAIAAAISGLIGAAFVAKPWVAPVTSAFAGEVYRLSPTAETHLYFVIPGLGLCVLALGLASTIEIRKPVPPTPIRVQPIELDPPRPDPPKPPGFG